jgi:hypothetical protein
MKTLQAAGVGLLVSAIGVIAFAGPPAVSTAAKVKPVTFAVANAATIFSSDPLHCVIDNGAALKTAMDAVKAVPGITFNTGASGNLQAWCYYANTPCINACTAAKKKVDEIITKCKFTSCNQLSVTCNEIPG